MPFGNRLRELRNSKNLSQEELSNQLNQLFEIKTNKFTISRLENQAQKPKIELIEMLARFFDVSVDYMCGGGKFGTDSEYDEIMELRQDIRQNPDMKILFSLSKKAPENDVKEAIRLLQVLKKARDNEHV